MFDYFQLTNLEIILFFGIIFLAAFVRGFSGFGFSATSITGLSFIFPPKEIIPVILILEIVASILMLPSIWKKINWKFVSYLVIGVIFGTPIGVKMLNVLNANYTHLIISITVLIFAYLLLKGYQNKKLENKPMEVTVGFTAGVVNGFGTLAGLPLALYFLIIAVEPAVIRASIAALFFFTDGYAFILNYFSGIVDMTTLYRSLPLMIMVPLGIHLGSKLFSESSKATYKRYVLYFLIVMSIFGLIQVATYETGII